MKRRSPERERNPENKVPLKLLIRGALLLRLTSVASERSDNACDYNNQRESGNDRVKPWRPPARLSCFEGVLFLIICKTLHSVALIRPLESNWECPTSFEEV